MLSQELRYARPRGVGGGPDLLVVIVVVVPIVVDGSMCLGIVPRKLRF